MTKQQKAGALDSCSRGEWLKQCLMLHLKVVILKECENLNWKE